MLIKISKAKLNPQIYEVSESETVRCHDGDLQHRLSGRVRILPIE